MPTVSFRRLSTLLTELDSELPTLVSLFSTPSSPLLQPSTQLPVAPVYTGVAPEPVADTPEVAEAKAAHAAALEAAAAAAADRKKREADPAIIAGATRVLTAPSPFIHNAPVRPVAYAGLPYAGLGLGYAGLGLGYAGYGYAGLPYYG